MEVEVVVLTVVEVWFTVVEGKIVVDVVEEVVDVWFWRIVVVEDEEEVVEDLF